MNTGFLLNEPAKLQLQCAIPFLTSAWRRAGYNTLTQCHYNRQSRELQSMRAMFQHVWGAKDPLKGAVGVGIIYIVPMPKSWTQKRKKEMCGARCTSKPDFDNLSKFLLDAMTGIVYVDDCQCYGSASGAAKFWGAEGRTYIWVETDEKRVSIKDIEATLPPHMRRDEGTLGPFSELQREACDV